MRITANLNGWRRLGIVLVTVWLATVAAVLGLSEDARNHELVTAKITRTKTVMVPAPEMKEELESRKVKQLGRKLMPWEMEWNPRKEVQVPEEVRELSFAKVFLWMIMFPTLMWLVIEGAVVAARWIIAGFAIKRSPQDEDE